MTSPALKLTSPYSEFELDRLGKETNAEFRDQNIHNNRLLEHNKENHKHLQVEVDRVTRRQSDSRALQQTRPGWWRMMVASITSPRTAKALGVREDIQGMGSKKGGVCGSREAAGPLLVKTAYNGGEVMQKPWLMINACSQYCS